MSARSIVSYTLATLAAVALIVGCSAPKNKVILKIDDDYTLTVNGFRDLAARRFGGPEAAAKQPEKALENYLNDVLNRQLKVIDGYHKGLDNNPQVKEDHDNALKTAAISELYQKVIVDSLIPDSALKNFYDHDAEEVNASHILISIPDSSEASVKAGLERIKMVRQKLNADGSNFAEIAGKFSEDKSTIGNKDEPDGSIGWFRWGQMVKPFQDAAFSLPVGKVSEPIRTNYGWHLILVKGRRPVKDRVPFDQDKDRIRQMLMRQNGKELMQAAKNYIHRLEKERDLTYDDANVKTIFNVLKKHLRERDPFSLLTNQQQSLVLATMDDGSIKITAKDLKDYMRKYIVSGKSISNTQSFEDMIENYATENYLLPDDAKKMGLYDDPDVQKRAKDAVDARIYQLAQKQNVIDKAKPTDEEVKKYYEAHPQKYMTEAQYTLIEALVSSRKLADMIVKWAKEGKDLRKLAMKYSERANAKKNKGVLGPIRRGQYGAIGRLASEAKIGEIVGPVSHANKWSVFKVISKEEPRKQKFDEIKARIASDVRVEMRKTLEQTWEDSLHKAIPYEMNVSLLKDVFPNSPKKATQQQ